MKDRVRTRFGIVSPRVFSTVLLTSLIVLAIPAWSQEVTAAINGVVTDPSGGAVAGAKVTAKDLIVALRGRQPRTATAFTRCHGCPWDGTKFEWRIPDFKPRFNCPWSCS